jgi:hypothetical protein
MATRNITRDNAFNRSIIRPAAIDHNSLCLLVLLTEIEISIPFTSFLLAVTSIRLPPNPPPIRVQDPH